MNACIIGDGLISLTLAKTLINKKIKFLCIMKIIERYQMIIEQLVFHQII